MPIRNESRLVSFDADSAVRTARKTAQGTVYSVVEYTVEDFHPLYVADETIAMYKDREQMATHFKKIHTHVHMDLLEANTLVGNLFPMANRVEHITTAMDYLKLFRLYRDDEAVFLALGPEEPVEPLVRAMRPHVDQTTR
ncbi:hypothetical protein [Haloarchaeobius sp. TZWWS8]|uniref:hypothetical protein n=1 Tax=Haloarchaeobius sp. TZWWS8 TaxID=3446121 RepID=UPI003EBD0347